MKIIHWCRLQSDRTGAVALALAGAILLIVGWAGASHTAFPAEQIPFLISGGLGGLFLLGVAGALWVSADLRDEWRKLDRLEELVATGRVTARDGDEVPVA